MIPDEQSNKHIKNDKKNEMFTIEEAKKESENSADMTFTYAVNKL